MTKIILVDDNPVLIRLYTTRLELDQYEVKSASNGEEGLELLKTFVPDIMVIDLMMPKLNGFKFIEAVKSNPATKNIPIIVFSSMADPKSEELESQGVNMILSKVDTTPTQLVETIKTMIGKT